MHVMTQSGWLEVICGSMFSGKSEELIRRIRRAQFAKQEVKVFKPTIDNRYREDAVVSHNGNSVIAIPVATPAEMFRYISAATDVVAIDEVQFFSDDIIDVVQTLANRGYRVIAAGLDQDFRGEPFGPVPALMAIAESVTKLQAVCTVCGSPASRTQRLINGVPASYDDPVILVAPAKRTNRAAAITMKCRANRTNGTAARFPNGQANEGVHILACCGHPNSREAK